MNSSKSIYLKDKKTTLYVLITFQPIRLNILLEIYYKVIAMSFNNYARYFCYWLA